VIEDYKEFTQQMVPHIIVAMNTAAEMQVEADIKALLEWKAMLGPKKWKKLIAVVPVIWPVTDNNPREQILRCVMDSEMIDSNLFVIDGGSSVDDIKNTIGRIVGDRLAAKYIFQPKGDYKKRDRLFQALCSHTDLVSDSSYTEVNRLMCPYSPLNNEDDVSSNTVDHTPFIKRTIDVARENVIKGGRPFSCVIVRDGNVIEEQADLVNQTHDPLAHAEINAIRNCCHKIEKEFLTDCDIYVMSYPNPFTLGAFYYSCPRNVYYINPREEYSNYYKDDTKYFSFGGFYDEYKKSTKDRTLPIHHIPNPEGIEVFKLWKEKNTK